MAKFKVMSSVGEGKEFMNGVEFEQTLNENVGTEVSVMGGHFKVLQNGKILVLSNKDWVLTIMKQDEPGPEIDESEKIEANRDFEIYFKTKTFKINRTPLVGRGVSYQDFYEAVEKEWKMVHNLVSEEFPLKFNFDFDQLIFTNGWGWENDDFSLLRAGSWGTETEDGRSV